MDDAVILVRAIRDLFETSSAPIDGHRIRGLQPCKEDESFLTP